MRTVFLVVFKLAKVFGRLITIEFRACVYPPGAEGETVPSFEENFIVVKSLKADPSSRTTLCSPMVLPREMTGVAVPPVAERAVPMARLSAVIVIMTFLFVVWARLRAELLTRSSPGLSLCLLRDPPVLLGERNQTTRVTTSHAP